MKKGFTLTVVLFCIFSIAKAQKSYTPVDADSKVHFVIKNFGIKTGGDFTGLKGTVKFDPTNYSATVFDVTVDASTIDTDNDSRDGHLKKAEYFDVATYKTIHFKSTKVTQSSIAGRLYVYGNLTIKNITKPVEFGFEAKPKNCGYVFDGQFTINRRDFGVGGSSISLSDSLTVSLLVLAK